jgi:hypothetical protein
MSHRGSAGVSAFDSLPRAPQKAKAPIQFVFKATPGIAACICRCAFHWDNINEARLLVIRPAAPGWPWSGAFPLPEREDYFGLRLRNRCGTCRRMVNYDLLRACLDAACCRWCSSHCRKDGGNRPGWFACAACVTCKQLSDWLCAAAAPCRWSEAAIIIPVNSTVGRSGSCLITFKSTSSVPPFRIENRTKSVMVMMRQQLTDKSGPAPSGTGAGPSVLPGIAAARKDTTPRWGHRLLYCLSVMCLQLTRQQEMIGQ